MNWTLSPTKKKKLHRDFIKAIKVASSGATSEFSLENYDLKYD